MARRAAESGRTGMNRAAREPIGPPRAVALMDWSQISVGGRQTLCVVSAGASCLSIRGCGADAGSIGPLALASGKQTLVDWHCAPVLQALPVFAVVSASLQQSSCCACV